MSFVQRASVCHWNFSCTEAAVILAFNLTRASIPEPASAGVLGVAGVVLLARRRSGRDQKPRIHQ